jgi:N-acyl-D-amino-acid deacylase
VAILNGRIERIGDLHDARATEEIDAAGRVLAPGFIDVHTHDDTVVIRQPQMLPKLSQGVTTVIVGNCGISASPVSLRGDPPDPMNLLGSRAAFVYPTFSDYRAAVEAANTTLNVAALVGHTALRSNHLDDLYRTATPMKSPRCANSCARAWRPVRWDCPRAWPMPARFRHPRMKSCN